MAIKVEATIRSLDGILGGGNVTEIKNNGDVHFADGSVFKNNFQSWCGRRIEFIFEDGKYIYGGSMIAPIFWLTNIVKSKDWEEVKIDTLVKIKELEDDTYTLAYFKSYDKLASTVTVFDGGRSSKTQQGDKTYKFFDFV